MTAHAMESLGKVIRAAGLAAQNATTALLKLSRTLQPLAEAEHRRIHADYRRRQLARRRRGRG